MIKKVLLLAFILINVSVLAQTPILKDFEIRNSVPDKVYFTSEGDISDLTKQGFIISGKTISSLNVSEKSFTVSTSFTFWDNNTIRLKNGDGIVNDFTLTYIKNNISEPQTNTTLYVNSSVNASGDGSSEEKAFKTLTEAVAKKSTNGGVKIWVKAGSYNNEKKQLKWKSGKINSPNVIEGYKNTPGDINSMYYQYKPLSSNSPLDAAEMPLFNGGDRKKNTFWDLSGDRYIIFKNIQISNYTKGIRAASPVGILIDNVLIKDIGDLNKNSGVGIYFESASANANKIRISNSTIINATADAIFLSGQGNLIENCKAYTNEAPAGRDDMDAPTDYFFLMRGSNNIMKDLLAYKDTPNGNGHSGHGFAFKAMNTPTEYNLIDSCEAVGILGSIEFRHSEVQYCVAKDCISRGDIPNVRSGEFSTGGPNFNHGGSNNIVERMLVHDVSTAILFHNNREDNTGNGGSNNIVRNSLFYNISGKIIWYENAAKRNVTSSGNKIYNNTFVNSPYLIKVSKRNDPTLLSNNEFKNNIFSNITGYLDPKGNSPIGDWNFGYNDFFQGFTKPSGQGNLTVDPKFENKSSRNFKLKPDSPLIDSGKNIDDVKSDFEGSLRPQGASNDIGAFEYHDDTTTGSINANAGQDVLICQGESTTLTAIGGTSYSWSTGATTASINVSPVAITTYTVTVSDGTNSDTDDVIVTVNDIPTVSLGEDVTICFRESITLTAEGTGNFLWSTGETTASITVNPTNTTTYSVIVSNTCSTDATDEIIVNVTPEITLDVGEDVTICVGENITLTAEGNGDFLWSTGDTTASITVNPTATTNYNVTSSSGDCSISDEVTVNVNEPPTVDLGQDITICYGEDVTLTAEGNGDFLWSTGETTSSITVDPTTTTTYSVTASTACSLDATDEIIVNVTPEITLDVGEDVTICVGENITLTAEGNGDFLWSTGETTASITVNPTATTNYTVISSSGDCSISDEVTVTVDEPPTVDLGQDLTICYGEYVTLTAAGNGDFLWSTGESTTSITVNPANTTTYSVIASNTCNSDVTDEIIIDVTPEIILDAGADVTICQGENITLTASGNNDFLWSTGESTASITVNPNSTTAYFVTSSSGGCTISDDVIVRVEDLPTVSLGEDVTLCLGESITITAEGNGDFLWSTGETTASITVNPTNTTIYSVTASSLCSDDVTDEIIVNVNELPVIDAGSDVTIPSGSNTVLTAEGNGDFLWSTGETTSNITVGPTTDTIYTVTITSAEGCSSQDSVIVNISNTPESMVIIEAKPDQTICLNESVTLTATGGSNYLWNTGETTSSIMVSPSETTIFAVTISTGESVEVYEISIFVDETCSGISNRINEKESKLYPNPTEGVLNIELANFSNESVISIFDLNGRLVYSEIVDNYSPIKIFKRQINLSNFGKGIYFVRFFNNNISETKKVLVI